jgi:hypothetical protein
MVGMFRPVETVDRVGARQLGGVDLECAHHAGPAAASLEPHADHAVPGALNPAVTEYRMPEVVTDAPACILDGRVR